MRFQPSDITFCSLRRLGLKSPQAVAAKQWIEGTTTERDGEDGAEFWKWIEGHLNEAARADARYDTFLAIEKSSGRVVATVSIVNDDRGAAAQTGLPGAWLGGFNVHRDFRERGVGRLLLVDVLGHVERFTRRRPDAFTLNLYSANARAIGLFKSLGFEPCGTVVVEHFGIEESLYSRTFDPVRSVRPKAEVLKYISDLNTRALTYHNHKESSAWLAVAAYFAFMVPLLNGFQDQAKGSLVTKVALVALIIAVTTAVLQHMVLQYSLRSFWGDVTAACYRLASRVLVMSDDEVAALDLSLPPSPAPGERTATAAEPECPTGESDLSSVFNLPPQHAPRSLPRCLRDEIDNVVREDTPLRNQLASSAFVLLFLGFCAGLLKVLVL